jgi:protocatechuate 4,5-dioxygenase beta chain
MYAKSQEAWDQMWARLSLDRGIPQPAYVAEETGEKLQDMIRRIDAGHAKLIEEFDAYKPDLLIIIGGDQTEMFDRSNVPQFMIYTGATAYGSEAGKGRGPDAPKVYTDIDVEYSQKLLSKLVKEEGFDVAFSSEMENFGRGHGLPHAFANMLSYIMTNTKVPTVLVYENTYDPPSLSAKRCYDFGAAIARIAKRDNRRIAIMGSGGLAHDPGGKRSGWLDQPLDKWFLEQIADGNGKATEALYSWDSDTMIAGTGEIRAWITVAGAMEEMGSHANVVDYIPGGKTVTGLSTAYWNTEPALAGAR